MLTTRVKTGVLFLLALLLSALAFYFLGDDGFFAAQFSSEETGAMFLEIGVLFLLLFVSARRVKSCQRGIANALICALFAARHLALFSVLIAGIWLAALALFGRELLGDRERLTAERAGRGLLLGAAAWIVLVAFFSALHLGGTRLWRILASFVSLAAFLPPLLRYFGEKGFAFSYHCTIRRESRTESLLAAATVTAVLVQLGRMNIAIDYDSLRYALRSPFVLDNGRGIFESLGSVNQVYFYPKGLEILALPLYTEHSFGPVLAFSFCLGIGLLWLLFDLGRALLGAEGAKRLVFTAALIPGVMNLSISAKTDLITVLFQLIAVRELLTAEQSSGRARADAFVFGASAVLFTLMLKPTAIVFSGGLVFAALLYAAVFRPRFGREKAMAEEKKEKRDGNPRGLILPPLFTLLAFIAVTARTLHLTGYPLVSVFTGVFEALGFRGKYPLAVLTLPNAGASLTLPERGAELARRLFLLFFAPIGEEGLHIRIAWGTTLIPVLLAALLLRGKKRDAEPKSDARAAALFGCLIAVQGGLLLLSLERLHQIDGNYYGLFYLLLLIGAFLCWKEESRALTLALAPASVFAFFMLCLTNWAGARGFSGYGGRAFLFHPHGRIVRDVVILDGADPIYRYVKNAPRMRVLSFAGEPECYFLPCDVQSYTDLEGSGGNVYLVRSLDAFKEFLDCMGINCLYTDDDFLATHERAADIIRYLREEGSIEVIIEQEGNALYRYRRAN